MGTFLASLRRSAGDQHTVIHMLLFFLGACIGLLLLTWYARHPFLLAGDIPFTSEDFMPYFRNYIRPEPLEGHLYHLGFTLTFASSLLAWAAGMAFLTGRRQQPKQLLPWFVGGTILMFGAFVISLLLMVDAVTVRELLRYIAFGVHPVIFIAMALVCTHWVLCNGWMRHSHSFLALELLGVFFLVVLIFFNPRYYSISLIDGTAGYHVWFFLAPVHDVLQGKHLLVDTNSQYGVLLIQALALLFRAGVPFSFPHFTLILMILSVVYHFFLYLILRATVRDRFLALLGILLILSMGFLRDAAFSFPGEPYVHPSALKLRFLFDLPVMAFLVWHARRKAVFTLPIAAFLCAVAVLWNSETGISLSVTYLAYAFVDAVQTSERQVTALRRIVLHAAILAVGIAAVIGLFTWWTFAASGSFPDFSSIPLYMRLYYSGFGALPMPVIGAWCILLFLYAVILLQTAQRMLLGKADSETALRMGWAVYGLMIFHYYISHSASVNLSAVTVPAIVLGLLLLRDLRPWLRHTLFARDAVLRTAAPLSLLAIVFILSLELTAGYATAHDLLLKRWASSALLPEVKVVGVDPKYSGFPLPAERHIRTTEAIRALVPSPARPLILSQQDFLHFWVLDSTNALSLPYQRTIALMQEVRALERQIDRLAPRYLFLDPPSSDIDAVPPCALCEELRSFVKHTYIFRRNIGLLDVYERRLLTVP